VSYFRYTPTQIKDPQFCLDLETPVLDIPQRDTMSFLPISPETPLSRNFAAYMREPQGVFVYLKKLITIQTVFVFYLLDSRNGARAFHNPAPSYAHMAAGVYSTYSLHTSQSYTKKFAVYKWHRFDGSQSLYHPDGKT